MTCIICELNPIHNGHKYLMDKAAEDGPVVLIMSGCYTQRGSAAVCDKYTRARSAVAEGADLVLELPFPWCCAGAADFARAGVGISSAVGAGRLMFGSGCGDAELLRRAGEFFAGLDGENFDEEFFAASKENPGEGAARMRERILGKVFSEEDAARLCSPNDILGVEYWRYSILLGGPVCTPVKRLEGEGAVGASEIRKMLKDGRFSDALGLIPDKAAGVLRQAYEAGSFPVLDDGLYDIERILLRMGSFDFEGLAEASGGLGSRLKKSAGTSASGEDMLKRCATKKYTDARIRRAALYSVLGVSRENVKGTPLYTSVLGIGSGGKEVLRGMKKSGRIETLTKAADYGRLSAAAKRQFELSAAADRLYTLLMPRPVPEEYFLTVTPCVSSAGL